MDRSFWPLEREHALIDRADLYPDAEHVVVGASYAYLRDVAFPKIVEALTMRELVEERDFVVRKHPTPEIRLVASGARIRSLDAADARRIRGVSVQTVYLEEPQTWDAGTVEAIVGRVRPSMTSAARYPDMPCVVLPHA